MLTWINMGEQPAFVDVEKVEQRYAERTGGACKFIGMLTIKTQTGWSDDPVAVFWQEKVADPTHSNYFGLYVQARSLMICNAISVAEGEWSGVLDHTTGEIVFSRYRHDYRQSRSGTVFADGGRDYFRGSGKYLIKMRVEGPKMVIVSGLPEDGADDV
jgi:hypothetical protein